MIYTISNPMQNYSNSDCCAIIFIIIFFIIMLSLIGCGCAYRYNPDTFANTFGMTPKGINLDSRPYNALYTSPDYSSPGSFMYTQPPGDTNAQQYGRSGQGTNGEFFPIQGRAAGTFMQNSAQNNLTLPSSNVGKIGGGENYTKQQFSSRWNGFNNFGSPFSLQRGPAIENDKYSNSYLIDGANQRVLNSGQKGNLPAQQWWPTVKKGSHGFCTQDSDAMVPCSSRTISSCKGQGGERFVKNKFRPQWKKVINP